MTVIKGEKEDVDAGQTCCAFKIIIIAYHQIQNLKKETLSSVGYAFFHKSKDTIFLLGSKWWYTVHSAQCTVYVYVIQIYLHTDTASVRL